MVLVLVVLLKVFVAIGWRRFHRVDAYVGFFSFSSFCLIYVFFFFFLFFLIFCIIASHCKFLDSRRFFYMFAFLSQSFCHIRIKNCKLTQAIDGNFKSKTLLLLVLDLRSLIEKSTFIFVYL